MDRGKHSRNNGKEEGRIKGRLVPHRGPFYYRMVVKWGGAIVEVTVRVEALRNNQRISDMMGRQWRTIAGFVAGPGHD